MSSRIAGNKGFIHDESPKKMALDPSNETFQKAEVRHWVKFPTF